MKKTNILIITKSQNSYDRKTILSGYKLILFRKKALEDFDYIQEIRFN